jgi:hypothetical protein
MLKILKETKITVESIQELKNKNVDVNNEILINKLNDLKIQDKNNSSPFNCAIECITTQKNKEKEKDIWGESILKDITTLQKNNVGCVGEQLLQKLCEISSIKSNINGNLTKKKSGGNGDGFIKSLENTIEIKTAYLGSGKSKSFQHELGEFPWKAKYMCFINISPNNCIYITIFKNWLEKFYKESASDKKKCKPYFPTKSITRRHNSFNFKFDTTISINETNVKNGYTLKITEETSVTDITNYINKIIK